MKSPTAVAPTTAPASSANNQEHPLAAEKTSISAPSAARGVFTKSSEDDCTAICDKVQTCHVGPFATNRTKCEAACEGSNEDEITSKTYDCIAAATSCTAVKVCPKQEWADPIPATPNSEATWLSSSQSASQAQALFRRAWESPGSQAKALRAEARKLLEKTMSLEPANMRVRALLADKWENQQQAAGLLETMGFSDPTACVETLVARNPAVLCPANNNELFANTIVTPTQGYRPAWMPIVREFLLYPGEPTRWESLLATNQTIRITTDLSDGKSPQSFNVSGGKVFLQWLDKDLRRLDLKFLGLLTCDALCCNLLHPLSPGDNTYSLDEICIDPKQKTPVLKSLHFQLRVVSTT